MSSPWENLDIGAIQKLAHESLSQADLEEAEIREDYARIFTTKSGMRVLEHLKTLTYQRNNAWAGDKCTLAEATSFMLMRDGQNSIVRHIEEYVKAGEKLLNPKQS